MAGQKVSGLLGTGTGLIETFQILDPPRAGRRWLARRLVAGQAICWEAVVGQKVCGFQGPVVGIVETFEILDSWHAERRWLAKRLVAFWGQLWAP